MKIRQMSLSAAVVLFAALAISGCGSGVSSASVDGAQDGKPQTEVAGDANGAVIYADVDIAAAKAAVLGQFEGDAAYDVTDCRTYRIYVSALDCPAEKQTDDYLGSYYDKGYEEGNVIFLQCDEVEVLCEAYNGEEWPQVVELPGWGYWLGRDSADGSWEILGSGY